MFHRPCLSSNFGKMFSRDEKLVRMRGWGGWKVQVLPAPGQPQVRVCEPVRTFNFVVGKGKKKDCRKKNLLERAGTLPVFPTLSTQDLVQIEHLFLTNQRDKCCTAVCRINMKRKNPTLAAGKRPLSCVCYVSETTHIMNILNIFILAFLSSYIYSIYLLLCALHRHCSSYR